MSAGPTSADPTSADPASADPASAAPWAEHERCAVEDLGAQACVVVEVPAGPRGAAAGRALSAAVLVLPPSPGRTPYSVHERLNRALAARGLAPVEQTRVADPADLDPADGLRHDDVRRRMERDDLPTSGFTTLRTRGRVGAGSGASRDQGPRIGAAASEPRHRCPLIVPRQAVGPGSVDARPPGTGSRVA